MFKTVMSNLNTARSLVRKYVNTLIALVVMIIFSIRVIRLGGNTHSEYDLVIEKMQQYEDATGQEITHPVARSILNSRLNSLKEQKEKN